MKQCGYCHYWEKDPNFEVREAEGVGDLSMGTCTREGSILHRYYLSATREGCRLWSVRYEMTSSTLPDGSEVLRVGPKLRPAPEPEPAKPRGFLICPVRGFTPAIVQRYVDDLEEDGWEIHWPYRDTEQEDASGGWNICCQNMCAIKVAERVFVYWTGESYGSHFDLGMAFAFRKPITLLYADYEKAAPKSFQKMMRVWELLFGERPDLGRK